MDVIRILVIMCLVSETLFLDMTKFLSVDMANAFHRSITFYFWVLLWIGYFWGIFSGWIREKYMKRHPKKEMSRRKKILLLLGIAAVVIIAFTLRCLGDLMVIFQGAGVMAVILFWYSGYEEGQRFLVRTKKAGDIWCCITGNLCGAIAGDSKRMHGVSSHSLVRI